MQTAGMSERRLETDESVEPMPEPAPERWPAWSWDLVAAVVVMLGGIPGVFGVLGAGPGLFASRARVTPMPGGAHQGPALLPGLLPPEAPLWLQLLASALVVVPAALMFLRRRFPLAVFLAALGCFVLVSVLAPPPLSAGIAVTIAAFTLAGRTPRRVAFFTIAGAVALVLLLSLAAAGWQALEPRVFQVGAAFAIAAALGDSARSRREYLMEVTERAVRAERTREVEARRRVSEERLRIARDLHDTVAHQLSVINLHAGAASGHLHERPEQVQGALGTIRDAARGALSEIGELLRYLRDDERAGAPMPQQGLDGLDALLQRMRASGLSVETQIDGELTAITGSAGSVAYRVIQEGLTNAHKHGAGARAALRIEVGAVELRILVENPLADGAAAARGANPAPPLASSPGLGLPGIRERVAVLRGSVATSRAGGRFRLEVWIPMPAGTGRRGSGSASGFGTKIGEERAEP